MNGDASRTSNGEAVRPGEIHRWEVHHPPERIAKSDEQDATFVRVTQVEPYWATTCLTLFAESDEPGTDRLSMYLHPDMLGALMQALAEARVMIERRAASEGNTAGDNVRSRP